MHKILRTKVAKMVRDMNDDELYEIFVSHLSPDVKLVSDSTETVSSTPSPTTKIKRRKGKKRFGKKSKKAADTNASDSPTAAVTPKAAVDKDKILGRIRSLVKQRKGVSVSQVADKLTLDKVKTAGMLKALVEKGEIARGGERRFCRYAETSEIAEKASLAARGKK